MTDEEIVNEVEALWDTGARVMAGSYLPEVVKAVRNAWAEVERLKVELKASNETIDMLYARAGRFAEQADKHEAEVTRLRRHLGEIE